MGYSEKKEVSGMSRKRVIRPEVLNAKTFEEIPPFLNTAEVAYLTGQKQASIRKMINEGRLEADKPAGEWRIARDVLFPNAKGVLCA